MTRSAKAFLIFAGLFAFCTACDSRTGKYSPALDEDQLTHLLLDLQFAEVTLTGLPDASKDSLRTRYWLKLSEIYGLAPEVLREEVRQLEMDPRRHMAIVQRMSALHDSIR